jgi:predicted RNA-binding Zn-ribbon protein involved in translation (DUF1610 family)
MLFCFFQSCKNKEMAKSKAVRERVHQKFGGHCAYCGTEIPYKEMQVDHYYPQCKERFYQRRFGINVHAEDNLMPTCRRCNHYKRARTPKQFKELMKGLHERLESIYILKVAVDYGMATIQPFDGSFYFEKLKKQREEKPVCQTNGLAVSSSTIS